MSNLQIYTQEEYEAQLREMQKVVALRPEFAELARIANGETKTGQRVKHSILKVYEMMGGDVGFALWALTNPTQFYTKVLTRLADKNDHETPELNINLIIKPTDLDK